MPLDIEKVKKLMRQKRLQQRELAGMCGVTEAAMSRYLAGIRQPRSETLANMATALATTSNDLLGIEEPADVDEVFRLVARNAAGISKDVRLQLIKLLSSVETDDDAIIKKG